MCFGLRIQRSVNNTRNFKITDAHIVRYFQEGRGYSRPISSLGMARKAIVRGANNSNVSFVPIGDTLGPITSAYEIKVV